MTKICRKLKNVEITEDDDYEDNSDLQSFEPVSCMEYPEQFNDWSDFSNPRSAQIVVKGIYIQ